MFGRRLLKVKRVQARYLFSKRCGLSKCKISSIGEQLQVDNEYLGAMVSEDGSGIAEAESGVMEG